MIGFVAFTDVPGLFFETKFNCFFVRVEVSDFVTLLILAFFLMSDSSYFNSVLIYLQFYSFLWAFFIIFTRVLIFLLVRNDAVYPYYWFSLLLFFLFFLVNQNRFLFLFYACLVLGLRLLLYFYGRFGKITLCQFVKNFGPSSCFCICWGCVIFWNFLNSSLLSVLVKLSHLVSDSSSVDANFPKFVVGMMEIDFLSEVEIEASNILSLSFHVIYLNC